MGSLTAWKFDTVDGAVQAEAILARLSKDQLINVYDAATVQWGPGSTRPKTRQASHLVGDGALGGAFWGLLFGLLFFVPLLGKAVSDAGRSLSDVGIGDEFTEAVRRQVTPGTSALFVLASDAVLARVGEAFHVLHAELIRTNLSDQDEATLRAAFSEN